MPEAITLWLAALAAAVVPAQMAEGSWVRRHAVHIGAIAAALALVGSVYLVGLYTLALLFIAVGIYFLVELVLWAIRSARQRPRVEDAAEGVEEPLSRVWDAYQQMRGAQAALNESDNETDDEYASRVRDVERARKATIEAFGGRDGHSATLRSLEWKTDLPTLGPGCLMYAVDLTNLLDYTEAYLRDHDPARALTEGLADNLTRPMTVAEALKRPLPKVLPQGAVIKTTPELAKVYKVRDEAKKHWDRVRASLRSERPFLVFSEVNWSIDLNDARSPYEDLQGQMETRRGFEAQYRYLLEIIPEIERRELERQRTNPMGWTEGDTMRRPTELETLLARGEDLQGAIGFPYPEGFVDACEDWFKQVVDRVPPTDKARLRSLSIWYHPEGFTKARRFLNLNPVLVELGAIIKELRTHD
jgi:hypothetical protein